MAVSFGAFSILMYLLARSSASETVAWLYLVPPLAAFFSWLILTKNSQWSICWVSLSSVWVFFWLPGDPRRPLSPQEISITAPMPAA